MNGKSNIADYARHNPVPPCGFGTTVDATMTAFPLSGAYAFDFTRANNRQRGCDGKRKIRA